MDALKELGLAGGEDEDKMPLVSDGHARVHLGHGNRHGRHFSTPYFLCIYPRHGAIIIKREFLLEIQQKFSFGPSNRIYI